MAMLDLAKACIKQEETKHLPFVDESQGVTFIRLPQSGVRALKLYLVRSLQGHMNLGRKGAVYVY